MMEPLMVNSSSGEDFFSEESLLPTEQQDWEDVFTDLQPQQFHSGTIPWNENTTVTQESGEKSELVTAEEVVPLKLLQSSQPVVDLEHLLSPPSRKFFNTLFSSTLRTEENLEEANERVAKLPNQGGYLLDLDVKAKGFDSFNESNPEKTNQIHRLF